MRPGLPGCQPHGWRRGARLVSRRDVFQVARADVAFRRLLAPALYRREPLEALIDYLVGDVTFDHLPRRLLINTVDLHSGMQVMWGLPGLPQHPGCRCSGGFLCPARDLSTDGDQRPRLRRRRRD